MQAEPASPSPESPDTGRVEHAHNSSCACGSDSPSGQTETETGRLPNLDSVPSGGSPLKGLLGIAALALMVALVLHFLESIRETLLFGAF